MAYGLYPESTFLNVDDWICCEIMLNVSIIYIERGVNFYVLPGDEQNKLSKDDI